jgi:hypothetical protein
MIDDDFLVELRMFEGGGVEEYVASRGPLLPQDEIDVLDLWSMARLALWEVADKRGAVVTSGTRGPGRRSTSRTTPPPEPSR